MISIISTVKGAASESPLVIIASVCLPFVIDVCVFHSFRLNYILIGMAFSATLVNLVPEEKTEQMFLMYAPVLTISLVLVIVNLGIPLDYRLMAGEIEQN